MGSMPMAASDPIRQKSSRNLQKRTRATDFDRRLGLRIRERRIALGISQERLAELIGVTYQQAHKYEKGINRISLSRFEAVCRILGWTIQEALAGIGEPPRQLTLRERRLVELAENLSKLEPRLADAVVVLVRELAREESASALTCG
jgi:transcriptional regulator with XRE-family HTH domain